MSLLRLFAAACATVWCVSAAQAETWKIASLDWPPYSGAALPGQGKGIEQLRKILSSEGIELEVVFLPWARAIDTAKNDSSFVGYYPAWPEEVVDGFFRSGKVFDSPLGLIERKDNPIAWSSVDDLKGMVIGIVASYGYPAPFMALAENGAVKTDESKDDTFSLLKLAKGRTDGALVDTEVFAYLVSTDPDLAEASERLQVNPKRLEVKDLVIAFKDIPENKVRSERIAAMLATMGN
jgi:polar amino acid transport system substrate-binding protein